MVMNSVVVLQWEAWWVSWEGRNRAVCHLRALLASKRAQGVEKTNKCQLEAGTGLGISASRKSSGVSVSHGKLIVVIVL